MVIDGKSGKFLGEHFTFQLKTQDADQNGGLGYMTTSAAGEYGCVAIKCSADDALSDGVGKGDLKVFPGTKEAIKVPIVVQHGQEKSEGLKIVEGIRNMEIGERTDKMNE